MYKVLREDGKFLFADIIRPRELNDVKRKLAESGFEIIQESEITENVVEALNRDTLRRESLIRKKVPGFLVGPFDSFAATKGTERYKSFTNGTYGYWSFTLRKNGH